jgi:hypothetical protein
VVKPRIISSSDTLSLPPLDIESRELHGCVGAPPMQLTGGRGSFQTHNSARQTGSSSKPLRAIASSAAKYGHHTAPCTQGTFGVAQGRSSAGETRHSSRQWHYSNPALQSHACLAFHPTHVALSSGRWTGCQSPTACPSQSPTLKRPRRGGCCRPRLGLSRRSFVPPRTSWQWPNGASSSLVFLTPGALQAPQNSFQFGETSRPPPSDSRAGRHPWSTAAALVPLPLHLDLTTLQGPALPLCPAPLT